MKLSACSSMERAERELHPACPDRSCRCHRARRLGRGRQCRASPRRQRLCAGIPRCRGFSATPAFSIFSRAPRKSRRRSLPGACSTGRTEAHASPCQPQVAYRKRFSFPHSFVNGIRRSRQIKIGRSFSYGMTYGPPKLPTTSTEPQSDRQRSALPPTRRIREPS